VAQRAREGSFKGGVWLSTIKEMQEELKRLQKECKEMREIKEAAEKSIRQIGGRISVLQNNLQQAKAKLSSSKTPLVISDHALIRFAERRAGINFEPLREEILNELKAVNVNNLKVSGWVIRDGVVVTYAPSEAFK